MDEARWPVLPDGGKEGDVLTDKGWSPPPAIIVPRTLHELSDTLTDLLLDLCPFVFIALLLFLLLSLALFPVMFAIVRIIGG